MTSQEIKELEARLRIIADLAEKSEERFYRAETNMSALEQRLSAALRQADMISTKLTAGADMVLAQTNERVRTGRISSLEHRVATLETAAQANEEKHAEILDVLHKILGHLGNALTVTAVADPT